MRKGHERLCEVIVEIGGHRPEREKEIIRACGVEWFFKEEDFFHRPTEDGSNYLLQASALGDLYPDEPPEDISGRLMRGVWRANGGLCHVEVDIKFMKTHPLEYVEPEEVEAELLSD